MSCLPSLFAGSKCLCNTARLVYNRLRGLGIS